jgi:FSR family fosmidomycin resistance protein-like MFS transporter
MLVVYIGSGIFHPAAAGIVQNLIPSRKSFAITVFASGGALGLSLSQLIFSQIYMSQPSLTSVLFFLPIFALVFLQNSKNYPENLSPKRPFDARNLIRPFTSGKNKKAFSFLYFSQLCQQAVVYGFIFFLPDILRLQGHSPLVCLGLGHCMLIIGSGFMLIPFGLLADFFGQKAVLLFLSFLNTILFYLFIFKGSQSGYLVNLLLFSLGATLGSFNPIGVSFGNRLVANKTSSVSAILMGGVWCFSHIIGSGLGGFLSRFFIENAAIGAMSLLGFLLPLSFIFVSLIPSKKLLDIEGTNDIPVSAGNANEVKG